MFSVLKSLEKAAAGVVIEALIAALADLATAGGLATDREETYTTSAAKRVLRNLQEATTPNGSD